MPQSEVFRDNPTLPALCQTQTRFGSWTQARARVRTLQSKQMHDCVFDPKLSEIISLYWYLIYFTLYLITESPLTHYVNMFRKFYEGHGAVCYCAVRKETTRDNA